MRLVGMPGRGFTLIELMISLAIFAFLLVLGIPNYIGWLADSQIRNAAESIADGLRYAQAQAVNQNQSVRFTLDPTTKTGGWTVILDAPPNTPLQAATFAQGADQAVFVVSPGGATEVTYTGLGRTLNPNSDASKPMYRVDITNPAVPSKQLSVVFGIGAGVSTGIKVCDPAWPATDPKGCPT